MVFNWFRRKFTQTEESPAASEGATDTTTAAAVDPAVEDADHPNEEQDRSEEDATSAPPAKPAVDYLSWAKQAYQKLQGQPQVEPQPVETPTLTPVVTPEPPEPEIPALTNTTPPAPPEVPALDDEPPPQPEQPAPAAPVPSSAAIPTAPATTNLDFDEGFLWSAEVLASQGRRPEEISVEEITWLQKLRRGLGKTRQGLTNQLKAVVGQGPLNEDGVLEIEALLLQADVGVTATDRLVDTLQTKLRQETLPPDAAVTYLKQILQDLLDQPLQGTFSHTFAPSRGVLNVWLMTGVNGSGKTTTIGKLAHLAKASGYHCMIAAADTFRAAAVEQVKVWGERSQVEVIANPGKNTDPAAVVFDAIAAAESRGVDLLLVDTAGRLQNKKNLMDELAKVRRIIDKKSPNANIESLLVLDSTLGQNGLRQAQVFSEAAQLTGVVLTKLDGTAKGGVALAVVEQLGLPIRFIGAGEGITDLRPFSSYEFVEALLSN